MERVHSPPRVDPRWKHNQNLRMLNSFTEIIRLALSDLVVVVYRVVPPQLGEFSKGNYQATGRN